MRDRPRPAIQFITPFEFAIVEHERFLCVKCLQVSSQEAARSASGDIRLRLRVTISPSHQSCAATTPRQLAPSQYMSAVSFCVGVQMVVEPSLALIVSTSAASAALRITNRMPLLAASTG